MQLSFGKVETLTESYSIYSFWNPEFQKRLVNGKVKSKSSETLCNMVKYGKRSICCKNLAGRSSRSVLPAVKSLVAPAKKVRISSCLLYTILS